MKEQISNFKFQTSDKFQTSKFKFWFLFFGFSNLIFPRLEANRA